MVTALLPREVLPFMCHLGIVKALFRMNSFDCCIFDWNNPNGINSISDLGQLIRNANGTCGFNRIVPFPGGQNCWHGSLTLKSLDSTWESAIDLSDKSKITVQSNSDLLVQVKANERVRATLTVFEPCLVFSCRRSPSSFPRIVWAQEAIIGAGDLGPIDLQLSETNRSTAGLCN
ncbi:MAG: hypothetical protein HC831_21470 [Chloroflexia bacterium]|nr:hypothetical protein [Chloroflexia bacterium]